MAWLAQFVLIISILLAAGRTGNTQHQLFVVVIARLEILAAFHAGPVGTGDRIALAEQGAPGGLAGLAGAYLALEAAGTFVAVYAVAHYFGMAQLPAALTAAMLMKSRRRTPSPSLTAGVSMLASCAMVEPILSFWPPCCAMRSGNDPLKICSGSPYANRLPAASAGLPGDLAGLIDAKPGAANCQFVQGC